MSRWLDRWFSSTSRSRWVLDLLWVGGFVAVVVTMVLEARAFRPFESAVNLALIEGTQHRGIYREGVKLGEVVHRVERQPSGWRVSEAFALGGSQVGEVRLQLRRDLSLRGLTADVDLTQLQGISGSSAAMFRLLGDVGRLRVRGDCHASTGSCLIAGEIGSRRISHALNVGRGPVLPSAIYPLLARGVLGRQVELSLLDPMTLQRRSVTFTLVGRRTLSLGGQQHDAILLRQSFAGLESQIWLDRRGRVLKEELPLGLWIQHESWSEPG